MADPLSLIEKFQKKHKKSFTLSEAAVATGLSIDVASDTMAIMIEKYQCRLQVTDKGDLIYNFGKHLLYRGRQTFKNIVNSLLTKLWKVFTILFKAWISVVLVLYFLIFLILLLALLFSQQSQSKKRSGGSPDLAKIFFIFQSIFNWRTNSGRVHRQTDGSGYPYDHYEPLPGTLKKNKKNFIASVYDFVFGPDRVEHDSLHNAREIAAYLHEQNGILVHSEIEALTGLSIYDAENFFTDCLIRFQGEVKVNKNGVVYGDFNKILRGVGETTNEIITYYWDEYDPPYELTGNTGSRNFMIIFMNGFNLFFSSIILSGNTEQILDTQSQNLVSLFLSNNLWLGWIPFSFSLLFFVIPSVRWFINRRKNRQRNLNNKRKRLYKVIFQNKGNLQNLNKIQNAVNQSGNVEKLNEGTVKAMIENLIIDLQGDIKISDQGILEYNFPKVTLELEEVQKIRKNKIQDSDLGIVILDSE